MDQRFESKQLKVLIIEASSSMRAILTETLRDQGLTDITGMTSIKDALGILEVEAVDWIVTTTFSKEPLNAFHLLKLITENGALLATRVSLLIGDDEKELLPPAYSLGLMSHHPVAMTKELLGKEWQQLYDRISGHKQNLSLVAADYLRGYLDETCDHGSALALETQLWQAFPEQFELLEQALPHMQELGEEDLLKDTLKKLRLIYGEDEKDKWEFLRCTYLPAQDVESDDELDTGNNPIKQVVVIDPDETLHSIYESIFADFGAEGVTIFTDGAKALAHLEANPNPDLIIQEWRLPEVTGPLFLQKAIGKDALESQFVVHSSLLNGKDIPLAQELGVATVVEKPLERSRLVKGIVQVVRQHDTPTELISLARKVRFAVRRKDLTEAQACLSEYQQVAPSHDTNRYELEAECELLAGNSEKAKELAMSALKAGGHSIFVLNTLGRALVNMGDYPLALKCYARAQEISPMNFRRLCEIAEINSTLGEGEEAQAAIESAKAIAGDDDPEVAATEAKVAINSGDADKAKTLLSQLDSLESVVAALNNQAVAFARYGKYEDSFAQYQKTIDSIPDDKPAIKAAVQYNLGLAYTRADRYEDAVAMFEPLGDLKSKVGAKAKSLLTRLKAALNGGTKIVLSSDAKKDSESDGFRDEVELAAHLRIKAGTLCCYHIFTLDELPSKVEGWLENMPRFAIRRGFKAPSENSQKAS